MSLIERINNILEVERLKVNNPMLSILTLPADQNIPKKTETIVDFTQTFRSNYSTSPDYDDVNNYCIINEPGWYLFLVKVTFAAANKGIRVCRIYLDDNSGSGFQQIEARDVRPNTKSTNTVNIIPHINYFVPGYKLQIRVWHNAKTALNILSGNNNTSVLLYKLT